jgi:hypothetical protein
MSKQDEAGLILQLYDLRREEVMRFAANLEKLIDATPDGRKRTAEARERMKAIRAQIAQAQSSAQRA